MGSASLDDYLDEYVGAWRDHPRAGAPTGHAELTRLLGAMSEDVRYVDVAFHAVHVGHEGIREMARRAYEFSADLAFSILSSQTSGGRFAIEWEMQGTHTGSVGLLPETGKSFRVRGASIGSVGADGKVTAHRDYWNAADWMTQVGLADLTPRSSA